MPKYTLAMKMTKQQKQETSPRLYVDSYESDKANFLKSANEMLSTCVDVALQISSLKEFTGRDKPTVIT